MNYHIGTCSWKYPSWKDLVYSSRQPPDYLAEYSKKYNTVEVDQWFWSLGKTGVKLPRMKDVLDYDAATPSDFRFTIKCPNALTLTHQYSRKKGEPLEPNPYYLDPKLFQDFLKTLEPLTPKLGLLIFQFEYLNQQKVPNRDRFQNQLAAFLSLLPSMLPYAIEIRNPRWMDSDWFDLLKAHNAAPVLLQGYWMDPVVEMIEKHRNRFSATICVRMHGEDRKGMEERSGEDWSQVIRAKDEEIRSILRSLRSLEGLVKQIYLNINNHYEGSAPRTIKKIESLLFDDIVF